MAVMTLSVDINNVEYCNHGYKIILTITNITVIKVLNNIEVTLDQPLDIIVWFELIYYIQLLGNVLPTF